ncbi:MAG: hypothetical protein J6W21_06855 [Bacteroidaceae bacterium]|nr:hypothetical protein [Bacteroidaceae bacterium]
MKKLLSLFILFCSLSAVAQDTYLNEQTLNSSDDVVGTARFVGMGGAMGALGADMSVIGWNPAGIGLFRKSDVALTFGGLWNKNKITEESRGTGTFDQIGFVYNFKTDSEVCPYVNFAFNYQKKKNFFSNFYADSDPDNPILISQMDQLAELATEGYGTDWNLAGLVVNNDALSSDVSQTGQKYYYNKFYGDYNQYTHHSEGSLRAFEFNFSTNIKDRAFLGLTFGVDNLAYDSWTKYFEASEYVDEKGDAHFGDYSIWNDFRIHGYGFNFKLGGIVRPFEDNSFRIGVAIESPTWYKLKSSVLMDYTDEYTGERSRQVESYLDYNPRTPWKFRASMGSTIGSKFAWDVDYEFANYKDMNQRYPKYYDTFGGAVDVDMSEHTRESLRAVHTIRAGMEFRPISPLAFRLGYNFTSSVYDENAHYDQILLNSAAMDYVTRTNYMITKPTHILGIGMGYKWKSFYVDLAYKVRHQKADFYAFDDSFTSPTSYFSQANPDLANTYLAPVPVDLTRHSITCTLGFKF